MTFSMAGGCAATQDPIRGEVSFEPLKTSIAVFLAQVNRGRGGGPEVAVSYLLTPETVKELPRGDQLEKVR